ncbi:MAG: pyruvate ferredoxin oxidoreductase subunit gamma [Deltaproteobacteria bacterium]|nr:pyruvate ferredoxin oxidoreductase subunit gamma [Deltaproteobacteria bacterium]
MIEIRFHGRGGQGAVTAAALLAKAAGNDDKFSQGFPAFGVERRGAPVKAFTRIDDKYITIRSQVYNPDYILVMDSSLMDLPEITEGLKEGSVAIINGKGGEGNLSQKAHYYDATSTALSVLGKDIVNTAILGVFAKVTGLVSLDSILKAIDDNFPEKLADKNKQLVKKAYEETKV